MGGELFLNRVLKTKVLSLTTTGIRVMACTAMPDLSQFNSTVLLFNFLRLPSGSYVCYYFPQTLEIHGKGNEDPVAR